MSGASSSPKDAAGQGTGLTRHAAINLVGGIFTPAASFATGPILAHALSVDGRGELAASTMPLTVAITIATLGLPEAVTYFVAQDTRRTKMLLKRGALLILLPATIATVVLLYVSSWISDGNPTVQYLITWSAALLAPALLLSIIRAVAAAHNRWTAITVERIVTAASKLIPLVILFAMGELGLVAAAIVTIVSTLTGAIAYIPLLKLRQLGPASSAISTRNVFKFGTGIWIGSISGILLMRIDQVLLSPLSSAFELGLYAVAVSISELPLMVNSAIRETAFTHLSEKGVRPGEVGDLSRISTIIVLALCMPVAILSPFVIPVLFGRDFSGSVPVVLILLLAVSIGNPGSLAGVGLSSSGFPHLRSFGLVVACGVNIGLLFVLVPSLGAMGAAIATLAGNVVAGNMCIAWMIAKCGATIGDFYRFKAGDFVRVARILRRGFSRLTRRSEAK